MITGLEGGGAIPYSPETERAVIIPTTETVGILFMYSHADGLKGNCE